MIKSNSRSTHHIFIGSVIVLGAELDKSVTQLVVSQILSDVIEQPTCAVTSVAVIIGREGGGGGSEDQCAGQQDGRESHCRKR